MNKDNLKWLMILGFLLGIIGLLFIFFSDHLAKSLADGWFGTQYDYAPLVYESKVKAYTHFFLVTGGFLLGIGLSIVTFSIYKLLNINR